MEVKGVENGGHLSIVFCSKFYQNTMLWHPPFSTPVASTINVSFEYFTFIIGELKKLLKLHFMLDATLQLYLLCTVRTR